MPATIHFSQPRPIFVDGMPAALMAGLQLLAAALAFTWILRCRLSSVLSVCLALGGVFLPPLLYTLIRWP
jgi:amino acid permease